MFRLSVARGASALLLAITAVPAAAQAPLRPKLEVLIVIDQMRPDYFDRYDAQLKGGLGRFAREGTFYTNARQDHAVTETAPGHATVLSGRAPASTGIVTNALGVLDSATSLLLPQRVPGASPRRFQGSALFDWLLVRDSATRVLSVSRKDRGAILPVGRARGPVFWYSKGAFTTSTWYADVLPDWVVAWNARHGPARLAGKSWGTLLDASAYAEADSMAYEDNDAEPAFPHQFATDSTVMARQVASLPWMDSLTMDLALEGVRQGRLGGRAGTDLLVLSLSATDAIGHAYGPQSRELHDQILRLDKWLGWFLDSLAVLVPREATVFALTADHGVQPFPERTGVGGRLGLTALARRAGAALEQEYRVPLYFDFDSGLLTADVAALRARGVNTDSLAESLASQVRRHAGITEVFTPRSLERAPSTNEQARLWRRTIPASQEWLVAASSGPGWLWADSPGWTTHGSTQPLDMMVPIIFYGAGIKGRRVTRRVTTEDIGPTFAALAGVRPTEPVTGRALAEIAPRR
jgi:predicted AlkP superfamily pyrophosphatase or phosphodiesterase